MQRGRAGKEGKKQGKAELILNGRFFSCSISYYWRKWIGFLPICIKCPWFSNFGALYLQWEDWDSGVLQMRGSLLPICHNAHNDSLREVGRRGEPSLREKHEVKQEVCVGRAGQGMLTWTWEDVPCSNSCKRRGRKSKDVRENHGKNTGSVGRRSYSSATIHWLCHLTLVSPFMILHYK